MVVFHIATGKVVMFILILSNRGLLTLSTSMLVQDCRFCSVLSGFLSKRFCYIFCNNEEEDDDEDDVDDDDNNHF